MTTQNSSTKLSDEIVYIRTPKGQDRLNHGESAPRLDADQRRALLLVNGFTPVCALFGPKTLNMPVEKVLTFLLAEGLIMPIDDTGVRTQRKWFGPAVVPLAALLRNADQSSAQGREPDAGVIPAGLT